MLRREKDDAVSTIIGGLLTLVIVVVLFTSIFYFVTSQEGPEKKILVDFLGTYERSGSDGYINITHTGGKQVLGFRTEILIFIDSNLVDGILNISDGGIGDNWNIGETWQYNITGVDATSQVDLIISDKVGDRAIWRGNYGTLGGAVRPLIYKTLITPDPVSRGEYLDLYAWVYDQDDDLNFTRAHFPLDMGGGIEPLVQTATGDKWHLRITVNLSWVIDTEHEIRFEAWDVRDNMHEKTETVTLRHEDLEKPLLQYPMVIPDPIWEGGFFNVTTRITDPQGNLRNASVNPHIGIPDLATGRNMTTTNIVDQYRTETPIQAPPVGAIPQVYTLTVHAEDDPTNPVSPAEHTNEATVSFTVVDSNTPIISWAIAEPSHFTQGTPTQITAKVIDQENDVTNVYINMSAAGLGNHTLTWVPGTDLYSTWINDTSSAIVVDTFSDYNFTVEASDSQGHNAIPHDLFMRILNPVPGVAEQPPIITSVTITPHPVVVNLTFTIQTTIIDINGNLDPATVKVNLTSIGQGLVNLTDIGDGRTFSVSNITAPDTSGDYTIAILATDDEGYSSTSTTLLFVIPESGILEEPDIAVQDLRFSDEAPVHSAETSVVITAWVTNLGGTGNYTDITATIQFIDESSEGTSIIGNKTAPVYGVPSPFSINWQPSTGGYHTITAKLLNSTPLEDEDIIDNSNNETSRPITVKPSILLVDDDHATSDGGSYDTTSWMRSALRSADFLGATSVDVITSTDGPRWDTGDHPLKDYDIVIWMTGYANTDLITANDRASLETFLSHNRSLWVISESAMNDAALLNWQWANGTSVLHVDPAGVVTSNGPTDPVQGDVNHTVTTGKVYNTTIRGPFSQGDYITPDPEGDVMLTDGTGQTIAVSYNKSYKSVFFSWEFSKLLFPADQATLSFNIIKWLSGISEWSGEDLAISQLFANPTSPDYDDNFTITAKIRNNGASSWNVPAAFYLDGTRILLSDPRVNAGLSQENVFLNPGEEGDVYLNMLADLAPGYHTVNVIADPGNDISETNELNNQLGADDPIFDLQIYVRFTLLVVDDDNSPNNGGGGVNVTQNITDSLDEIGYNYTVHVVNSSDDGPAAVDLARYKGAIWMCGQELSNTLKTYDQTIIRDYIENEKGQIWIIGQDILWDLTGPTHSNTTFSPGSFIYDILHVSSVEHNTQTPDPIVGVDYNEIAHGMAYQTDSTQIFVDTGDRISPTLDAEGVFWQDADKTGYNAIQWESNLTGAKVVFMPWEYGFLSGLHQRPLQTTTRSDGTRATTVYLSNTFDADEEGWTYIDGDIFFDEFGNFGGDAGDSWGQWTNAQGHDANGALQVRAGTNNCNNAIPGWQETFNVPSAGNVYVSFWYNHWMSRNFESGEYSTVHVSIDDILYTPYGSGSLTNNRWQYISYLDQGNPGWDPQTGWEKYWFIANLGAGNHNIEIGMYLNAANSNNENAYAYFDDVYISDTTDWLSLYADDFEADDDFATWDAQVDDNRWSIRDDNGENDYGGHAVTYVPQGQRAGENRGGGAYYIQKDLGDLQSYADLEISFFFSCQDFEAGDNDPSLDLWYDGGWHTDQYMVTPNWDGSEGRIPDNDGDQTSNNQNDWYYGVFELNDANPAILDWTDVRMRFYRTGGNQFDELFLDDVQVTGFTGVAPPVTSNVAFPSYNPEDAITTIQATVTSQGEQADDAEYWTGVDPGEGLATNINPADGVWDEVDETVRDIALDVSGLVDGAHTYWIRGHSASGWGTPDSGILNIVADMPTTDNVSVAPNPAVEITTVTLYANVTDIYSSIDEVEWFYDGSDAGAGSNNAMAPVDGSFDSANEAAMAVIDISALSVGPHRILVRAKDSGDRWNTTIADGTSVAGTYVDLAKSSTPPATSNVQVTPDPAVGISSVTVTATVDDAESVIIQAEAYTGSDPGEGSGTPLTVPANGPAPVSIVVSGVLDISSLPEGTHTMYVRARQQSDGEWGLPVSTTFQIIIPDIIPPDTIDPQGTPNPTDGASLVTLTATVRDARNFVGGAEYKLDSTSGIGGSWTPMTPVIGGWDSLTEEVTATLNVTSLSYGEHWVYIRGMDGSNGLWGPHNSFRLIVTRPPIAEQLGVRSELSFMVLKFFDHPETRPELRVVNVDLNITSQVLNRAVRPMLGETYLVTAEIYNPGGISTNAVVKILDGNNIVTIQSVYVPSHSSTTIQGIWVPQIVGERNIIVEINDDPGEVFTFNNQAYATLNTYFFYDDMEAGTDKWTHDDTILLINGESKLDFMNPPVNSTIVGDLAEQNGFNWTTDTFHSEDESIYVQEANTTIVSSTADALVSIIIDSSTSMDNRFNGSGVSWLDVAKESSKVLLNGLSDISAVSIYSFQGSNPFQVIGTTQLAGGGRALVEAAIDSISSVGGMTPIWDTTGDAYMEVKTQMPVYPTLTPTIVVLSDGADYQSNDGSSLQNQKIEAASDEWAPWHDMDPAGGYPSVTYADHRGKYTVPFTDPFPGEWWTAGGGSFDGTRKGLLTSDIPIFTIGLALEHYDPPNLPVMNVWPGDGASTADAVYNGAGSLESGTTEYNLWRIANTSGAEYFYSPDTDQLDTIFQTILDDIAQAAVSRAPAQTGTRATSMKHITTETFSLNGSSSAELSFYHKYDLAFGYNGGVVMVGTYTGGGWLYQYVTPTQLYPSNLWEGAIETDDLGRRIQWAYNGVSTGGQFGWDYAEIDLEEFLGEDEVRVKFQYYEYEGGTGGGWWIDDIRTRVSRDDNVTLTSSSWDQWELTTQDQASGTYSWVNKDDTQGFKGGLDNSLYTQPIDLTNALRAQVSFNTKFNINETAARPPDGFRMEISADNGVTWTSMTLGVRSAWGLSGNGSDLDDNVTDGKSYTGLNPDNGWVEASTLTRLTTDLSGWTGTTVMLRFRMVTASDTNPYFGSTHYEETLATNWAGLWIDDVIVSGQSITG